MSSSGSFAARRGVKPNEIANRQDRSRKKEREEKNRVNILYLTFYIFTTE
jgi:hypothetical protein